MDQRHYLAWQKREVDEHKYFLSEKRGYEVNYNEAFLDWVSGEHAGRFRTVAERHVKDIEAICKECCGDTCKGVNACPVSLDTIHDILEDGF